MIKLLAHLIATDLKLFFRGKIAMFWTFAFPLLMLIMLMSLFGHSSKLGPVSLVLHDQDHSATSAAYFDNLRAGLKAQQSVAFTISENASQDADLILTLPAGFADHVAHGQSTAVSLISHMQAGPALDAAYGILRGFTDSYNLAGLSAPQRVIFPPPPEPVDGTPDYGLYLVTGLSGLIVLSTALMGFAIPLVSAREEGLFRMYQIFPMPTGLLVLAWWLSRLFITLLATLVMVAFAFGIYGVRFHADPAGIVIALIMLALGCAAFLSLGMLVAAISGSVAMATMVANLLYFPLLFSGNLMIPLGGLPRWAVKVLDCLPMNAMVGSMRHFIGQTQVWPSIHYAVALLAGMMVVCLALSARYFSWTPRE